MNKIVTTPKHRVLALAIALTAVATFPAFAGSLRVNADIDAATPTDAFGFTVRNEGVGGFDMIRVLSDRAHATTCAGVTARGHAFAGGGSLGAGDSVQCVGQPLTQTRRRNASIAVAARDGAGATHVRVLSVAQPSASTPEQGIAVLSAGGIHNDANSDGVLQAGETIAYHYTVLNLGTLALSGLAFADIGGALSCPQTVLAVGASMTCTDSYTITLADESAGMVLNQVDVGGTDAGGGPVQAGDLVLTQNLGGDAGVRVFKSPLLFDDADASGYASAGDLVAYTFVVKNDNAQALGVVDLVEPDPTRIDTPISCVSTTLGGQPFTGLGSGTLASNDVVLCTATHTITAVETTAGSADNLVEVSAQPLIGAPVGGSGASAVVIPTPANVVIAKTLVSESGTQPGVAEPGETLTYTISLSNSGGADAIDVGVTDPLDPNVTLVSASNGGVASGSSVVWSGLAVPAGGNLALSVSVRVADPLPSGVTQIANLASVTGTTPPDCNATPLPQNCVITPTPGAVILTKALTGESGSTPGIAEAGETLTYTIMLSNPGGSAVSGYDVSDPLDPNVTFVSASNGGSASGGVVSWSNLTILAGGSVALTVAVQVVDPIPTGVTQVANVAYETGTTPPDCGSIPRPAACVVTPAAPPRLQVTKTVDNPNVAPGGTATYTITVTNVGTVTATQVVIADPLPAGIEGFSWTCAASGGATCANTQGTGAVNESIASFPVGGRLIYVVSASVAANATGSILNSVSVTPSANAVCMPAQTPGPCNASAPVTVVVVGPNPPSPAPTLGSMAMLLMTLALAATAWHQREKSRD